MIDFNRDLAELTEKKNRGQGWMTVGTRLGLVQTFAISRSLPTGCASPASRANSESKEMLAFAHIPTGTTTKNGFDLDEVNGRFIEPVTPVTAIGADIETGRVTP